MTTVPIISYASSETTDVFTTDFKFTNPAIATTTTVIITSISSTNVQGTFSGVLVSNNSSSVVQTVTNGKFNVDVSPSSSQSMNSRISVAKMQLLKNRVRY